MNIISVSGPVISKPFISEFHFDQTPRSKNVTNCNFRDKLIYDGEEDLNKIFYIIGIASMFIGFITLIDSILKKPKNDKKEDDKSSSSLNDYQQQTHLEHRWQYRSTHCLTVFQASA